MIVVDSSIWIEVFLEGRYSEKFTEALTHSENILIPAVVFFEVYKKIFKEADETAATEASWAMEQSKIVEVDENIAILAAKISVGENLGMGDSLIYATALLYNATLWTQDSDFKHLPQVEFFSKN